MSRIARIVLEGVPYHITQRGNGRQQVFFNGDDCALYLDLLRIFSDESGLRIFSLLLDAQSCSSDCCS